MRVGGCAAQPRRGLVARSGAGLRAASPCARPRLAADEVIRAVDERIPAHRLEHRDDLGDDRADEGPPHRRAQNALSERSLCSWLRHGEHDAPGRLQRGCSAPSTRFQRRRASVTPAGGPARAERSRGGSRRTAKRSRSAMPKRVVVSGRTSGAKRGRGRSTWRSPRSRDGTSPRRSARRPRSACRRCTRPRAGCRTRAACARRARSLRSLAEPVERGAVLALEDLPRA